METDDLAMATRANVLGHAGFQKKKKKKNLQKRPFAHVGRVQESPDRTVAITVPSPPQPGLFAE